MSNDRMKLYQSMYEALERIDSCLDTAVDAYTNPEFGGRPLTQKEKESLGLAAENQNKIAVLQP